MALSAATVLEVRTTGNDSNGGGFVTGASGTDYSQQDAAQYALTGLTTAAANAIILTASAAAVMVGNLIQITGGTNFTTGTYQITAVSVGVSITVDRNCTTAAGAAGTGNVGGALLTLAAATALMTVTGIVTWVKSGTYTVGTGITFPAHGTGYSSVMFVQGYTTTRGDRSTKPIVRATAGITIFTLGVEGNALINLDIDGNSVASVTGLLVSGRYNSVTECIIRRTTVNGISLTNSTITIARNEITGCSGTTALLNSSGPVSIRNCNIHDNTCPGINCGSNPSGVQINECLITNNTGASSDGVVGAYEFGVNRCTIYGNGRDGIRMTGSFPSILYSLSNNTITSNSGYGLNFSSAPVNAPQSYPLVGYNAFYSNTSGARSNISAGTGDVTLTGDPFTNAAGGDFSLNSTAGAGAACRAAGFPGAFPGSTTTGYADIGATQHQDSGVATGPVATPKIIQNIGTY